MGKREREEDAGRESDADAGVYRGRSVARRFVSPDGMTILVGRTAEDNDVLSLKLGAPQDFWMHVAGESGSHVVVRNPERLDKLPRATARQAAGLAAKYSKAKHGSRVAVHMAKCMDVHKQRGMPPGKVILDHYSTVFGHPAEID